MAAPKRYTLEQRKVMFQLYMEGLKPAAISRACSEGIGSVEPFQPPRRTVHDIVSQMEAEAESDARAPADIDELDDFAERTTKRIEAILTIHVAQLERKLRRGRALTSEELKTLGMAQKMSHDIQKSSRRQGINASRVMAHRRNGHEESEGELERLVRKHQREPGNERREPG